MRRKFMTYAILLWFGLTAVAGAEEARYDFEPALRAINHGAVDARHTGAGTTVVQFEDGDLHLDHPDFGGCVRPPHARDVVGWVPLSTPGGDCRIAWVQCFPAWQPEEQCRDAQVGLPGAETLAHATNVARGVLTVAPDTQIVYLRVTSRRDGRAFRRAVDWLLEPNWFLHGRTPAEYWNVVATNASYVHGQLRVADPDRDRLRYAHFSTACEIERAPGETEPQPARYILDWVQKQVDAGVEDFAWRRRDVYYAGYFSRTTALREAGILPLFASGNNLEQSLSEPSDRTARYKTVNGLVFPACMAQAFTVSGKAPWPGTGTRSQYIGTSSHPELTELVAPGPSSFATPLVAGAVAVLKGLRPDASLAEVTNWLRMSSNPMAPAGWSCDMNFAGADGSLQAPFPADADPSLDAGCQRDQPQLTADPPYTFVPAYYLPTLDLATAVDAALRGTRRPTFRWRGWRG